MKKKKNNIYIAILFSLLISTLYIFDMGIYEKNIYKIEAKQNEFLTLHNIKYISTIKIGNLKCYEGTAINVNDVYYVSCYRKSSFYPLYRTIDIKIIQRLNNGDFESILVNDQTAHYIISVTDGKFTTVTLKNEGSYYFDILLSGSLVPLLWLIAAIYKNKNEGEKD